MKSNKIKQGLINLLLSVAFVLSIVGGALLLIPNSKKSAYAETGLPDGLSFGAYVTSRDAISYNSGDYEYSSKLVDYVNINDIVYFVNGNTLYTDLEQTNKAKDVEATEATLDGYKIKISNKKDDSIYNTVDIITTDVFAFNDQTYYYKNDKVYNKPIFVDDNLSAISYVQNENDIYVRHSMIGTTYDNNHINNYFIDSTEYYPYKGLDNDNNEEYKLYTTPVFVLVENYSELFTNISRTPDHISFTTTEGDFTLTYLDSSFSYQASFEFNDTTYYIVNGLFCTKNETLEEKTSSINNENYRVYSIGENYYLINNQNEIYKLTKTTLQRNKQVVLYSTTYYYFNNHLYLLPDDRNLAFNDNNIVRDIKYTCNINTVSYAGQNLVVNTLEYYYVEINGTTYYINNDSLYTAITLGGDNVLNYSENDKVINKYFDYSVNTANNTAVFYSNDNMFLQEVNSVDNTVQYNDDITFNVDGNSLKTTITNRTNTTTKTFDVNQVYINYNFTFDTTNPNSSTLVINGVTLNGEYKSTYSKEYFDALKNDANNKYIVVNSGDYYELFAKFNDTIYHIFRENGNLEDANMYIYTDSEHVTMGLGANDYLVASGQYSSNATNVENTAFIGYKQYKIGTKTYFAFSTNIQSISDNIVSTEGRTLTLDSNNLLYNGLDANKTIFKYSIVDNTVQYYGYDASETQAITKSQKVDYVNNISNKNFVIENDDSNNQKVLYTSKTYGTNPSTTLDGSPATFNCDYVTVNSLHNAEFNIRSTYQGEYQTINGHSEYLSNSDVVLLNNFNSKNNLLNGSSTTQDVQSVYIGFGEDKPTNYKVTSLNVTAFLKNDDTIKYASISEDYFTEYGIRIDINSPIISDADGYSQYDVSVPNYYWYQYIDLGKAVAITSMNTTETIANPCGLYTFTFDFTYTYTDSNYTIHSDQYNYIYQLYITETGQYVEYPTFNVQSNNLEVLGVEDKTDINSTNVTYDYYYQTLERPVYIYNATRFNVEYNFNYNLEAHNYTTDFEINYNGNEKTGILNIYLDGTLDKSYTLAIDASNNAVNYYVNGNIYGSLYISADGEYLLSIENYTQYNNKNFDSNNLIDYYKGGKLIKQGAKNTPIDYYMVVLLSELGDYTFTNRYLISTGRENASAPSTFKIHDSQIAIDELYGKNFLDSTTNTNYTNLEILSQGEYTSNMLTLPVYSGSISPSLNTNPILRYYGIYQTFNKNGNKYKFEDVSKQIYSSVPVSVTFNLDTAITDFDSLDDPKTTTVVPNVENLFNANLTGNKITFDENKVRIPITNLQPIYFNYYGDIDYANSSYYRYQFCDFTYDENRNIKSVNFAHARQQGPTTFTSKTSFSSSGFYILKITFSYSGSTTKHVQYFMFAIDNTAPNLEIYATDSTGTNDTLILSSEEFGTSTKNRYSNTDFLKVKWNTPGYFQSDIEVKYAQTSYNALESNQNLIQVENGSYFNTSNAKYTFYIYYGVSLISNSSTSIKIDKTPISASLYSVDNDNGYISKGLSNYLFSSPTAVVTATTKPSGASVNAKIITINLDFANEQITDLNDSITANLILSNDKFNNYNNNPFDNAPIYQYASSIDNIEKSNLLGTSDFSQVYIVYLYDDAGNTQTYYYLYDISTPNIAYKEIKADEVIYTLDNNTATTSTNVIWRNNKAIKIADGENTLFNNLINSINNNSSLYGNATLKTVDSKKYLYVPINSIKIEGNNNSTPFTISSTSSVAPYITLRTQKDKTDSYTYNNSTYFTVSGSTSNVLNLLTGGNGEQYKFTVTDSAGNIKTINIIFNSSVAQETFYGIVNTSTSRALEKNLAYNLDKLQVTHLDTSSKNISVKLTYDYYSLNQEHFFEEYENEILFSRYCYDLVNGIMYMYSRSANNEINNNTVLDENKVSENDIVFVECEYNETSHTYNTKPLNIESKNYIVYSQLSVDEQKQYFIPGYPFVQTGYNLSQVTTKSGNIFAGDVVQGNSTRQGLYVFRRAYLDLNGNEITENDINSSYNDLADDYAVRYHVIYVDRNNIFDLQFKNSELDTLNSIGDLISIYLGQDDINNHSPSIDSNFISSMDSETTLETNKLRVYTALPSDKYATKNKLIDYSDPYNQLIKEVSIERNANLFKYLLSIKAFTTTLIDNNQITNDNNDIKNYDINHNHNNVSFSKPLTYSITISDNSALRDSSNNIINDPNKHEFTLQVINLEPSGEFVEVFHNNGNTSYNELPRININATYNNSNTESLSFMFSDTISPYYATINPYAVTVTKNGTIIFSTSQREMEGTPQSLYNTFNFTLASGLDYHDVFRILNKDGKDIDLELDNGLGAPYTYIINIFDKNNPSLLLSNYLDDATYTVTIKYKGNEEDYIVNGKNYFEVTYSIYIDRTRPQNNLNDLIQNDKNLNYYTNSIYGKGYNTLDNSQKDEVLKTYPFMLKVINYSSLDTINYYRKLNGQASYTELPNINSIQDIFINYATIFNGSNDDSIRLYYRKIDSLSSYKFTVLPWEDGYNDLTKLNGHNRYPAELEYVEYDNGQINFSTKSDDTSLIFEFNNYYEFIEVDQAGNTTRYIVYLTDNTLVNVDYQYYMNQANEDYTLEDTKLKDTYYTIINNEMIFIKVNDNDSITAYKPNTDQKIFEEYAGVELSKYIIKNINNTRKVIPTEVSYNDQKYEVYGIIFNSIYNNNAPQNALAIKTINFDYDYSEEKPNYLFDEFFTVNIYGEDTTTPLKTISISPYTLEYDAIKYSKNLSKNLQYIISEFNDVVYSNVDIHTYTFEIVNRFGENYKLTFKLRDATLTLQFSNHTTDSITVTLPQSSENVQLVRFSVYKYINNNWVLINTDADNKIIIQSPISDSTYLLSTTYRFNEGSYKFEYNDNYNFPSVDMKFVGSSDDSYEFTYSEGKTTKNDVTITNGNFYLLIDNSIYATEILMKNAIKYNDTYYDLKYVNGYNVLFKDNQRQKWNNDSIVTANDSEDAICYYRGRLYTNQTLAIPINSEDIKFYFSSNNIIEITSINGKNRYTFSNINSDLKTGEYTVTIYWATSKEDTVVNYSFKIDKTFTIDNIKLLSTSNTIFNTVQNQNYNRPFTISWSSDYATTATLRRTINNTSTTTTISQNHLVDSEGDYLLVITDEIGSRVEFSFHLVNIDNEYFSVIVNNVEIMASDYITSTGTSTSEEIENNKTIRYYFYKSNKDADKDNIVIQTDTTNFISCEQIEQLYRIYRSNIDYTICYIRVIKVDDATNNEKQFIDSIKVNTTTTSTEIFKDSSISQMTTTYTNTRDTSYTGFTITLKKYLLGEDGQGQKGNKIYMDHYFNGNYIKTYSSTSQSDTYSITFTSSGLHEFYIYDSAVVVDNAQKNAINRFSITLIKSIIYTVNNANPIDNQIFNEPVILTVPRTEYYNDIDITAIFNGTTLSSIEARNNNYTFTNAGVYKVIMKASRGESEYETEYNFTIINPNVTKLTFGFGSNYGFTIKQILRNQADITNTLENLDRLWITGGNEDSVGTYTITLVGYDEIANENREFTFAVRINNEFPTITAVNYAFGTKTNKTITLQYNSRLIYDQIGESYIRVTGDNGVDEIFEINAESLDELNYLRIEQNGTYRVTIYNTDGKFISGYTVIKVAPLNTSARIIIIIVVVVAVALLIAFIILRRHTKFR